jgi:DNA-directed RNA polymerase subunit H (RpoH/RPB5)
MLRTNRRTTFKWLAGGALAATGLPVLSTAAVAQADEVVVTNNYQNFKRGTIHSLHPDRRILNVIWEDLGRVKMRAADLVANYPQLKEGQVVDCNWFDYVDCMIAKKTAETDARAKAIMAKGARLTGIPGMQEPIRMWSMSGMVTRTDVPAATLWLINASNGRPDEPSPDSGEVIQLPQIQTQAGRQALASLKPGDLVNTVWTHQTAIKVTIIR